MPALLPRVSLRARIPKCPVQPLTPVAVKRSAARVLRSRFPNLFPSYAGSASPRGSSQIKYLPSESRIKASLCLTQARGLDGLGKIQVWINLCSEESKAAVRWHKGWEKLPTVHSRFNALFWKPRTKAVKLYYYSCFDWNLTQSLCPRSPSIFSLRSTDNDCPKSRETVQHPYF